MPNPAYLITATGTPLDVEERLHEEGLERHLADQWHAGIDGILIAGSMGLMQMLRAKTYRALVQRSAELSRGQGEVLIGVGDIGFVRTRERIEVACQHRIDGVVAVAPYFFRFPQGQMVDYFSALADVSPVPLYLYDLPARTGVEIDMSSYERLAKHPNIKGAKISGRIEIARQLIQQYGDKFRVIVAEPQSLADLLAEGVTNHLDGIFAVAPHWLKELSSAAEVGDWQEAAAIQTRVNRLLDLLRSQQSVFGAFTAMMNARGIPGNFHAAPSPALNEAERSALLATDIMQELLQVPSTGKRETSSSL
jgi:4-hydroxy-tetrahydrodipicolinate synthase